MDSNGDTWFLLVQHRDYGKTDVSEFDDYERAVRAYNRAEREYKSQPLERFPQVDVLLVGADNVESVKKRYPSYFDHGTSLQDRVAELLHEMPPVPAN